MNKSASSSDRSSSVHILAHRGAASGVIRSNSLAAFESAIDRAIGFELDIRDSHREIVVSHDPAGGEPLALRDVLPLIQESLIPVALNVKSDGLGPQLTQMLAGHRGVFLFDMPWPEVWTFRELGLPIAIRTSEYEPLDASHVEILNYAGRIWVDSFHTDWWLDDDFFERLGQNHEFYFVSPELHGRPYMRAWQGCKDLATAGYSVSVCTDRWDEACAFFADER